MKHDHTNKHESELLSVFAASRSEAAFGELVRRYMPLVLGVCRRVLEDHDAAQDVAQGVFLVLARKAPALDRKQSLGGWLHHVALCAARTERTARARRLRREQEAAAMQQEAVQESTPETTATLLREWLDWELDMLPSKFRRPLVMVYLEGRSLEETAAALNCKQGTLRVWLNRAREKLRSRLVCRGAKVSVPAMVAWLGSQHDTLAASVPPDLAASAAKEAVLWVSGGTAAAGLAPNVITNAKGILHTMFISKLKTAALLTSAAACIAAVWMVCMPKAAAQPSNPPSARTAEARTSPSPTTPLPESPTTQAPTGEPQPQPASKVSAKVKVSPYVAGALYEVLFECPARSRIEQRSTPTTSCMECHTVAEKDWPKIVEGKPQDLSALDRTRWGVPHGTSGGQKAPLYVKVGQEFEIEVRVSSRQIGAEWFQGPAPVEIFKEIKKNDARRVKDGVPMAPLSGDASSAEIVGDSVVTMGDTMEFVPHPRVPEEPAVGSYFLSYRAVKAGPSEIRLHSFRKRDQETQYVAEYILPVQVEVGTETVAAAMTEDAARELAEQWVSELLNGRLKEVTSLSGVPFCFDRKDKLKTFEELQGGLKDVIEQSGTNTKGISTLIVGPAEVLPEQARTRVSEGWQHLMDTDGLVFVAVKVEIDRDKKGGMVVELRPGNPSLVVGFSD